MSNRADVVTFVTTGDGEIFKGRYKWPKDMIEQQALRIVLHQFTREELKDIESVTFDPVVPLKWLKRKKTYLFPK